MQHKFTGFGKTKKLPARAKKHCPSSGSFFEHYRYRVRLNDGSREKDCIYPGFNVTS